MLLAEALKARTYMSNASVTAGGVENPRSEEDSLLGPPPKVLRQRRLRVTELIAVTLLLLFVAIALTAAIWFAVLKLNEKQPATTRWWSPRIQVQQAVVNIVPVKWSWAPEMPIVSTNNTTLANPG